MLESIIIFLVSLFLVIRGATFATKYSEKLAGSFHLSGYTVGFIIVAVISILPETFISINAALNGMPSFGLGTLFGSNVADMTLIFTVLTLFARRGIKVESKILKNNGVYPFLLLLPLVLGLDGHFSRLEGVALILVGAVFYYLAFRRGESDPNLPRKDAERWKHFLFLLFGMGVLLVGSHLTVISATDLAYVLGVNPVLIGMLVVGLGTTMPELFFSIKSIKENDDTLAVGDILGTVLADATIVVGILALINPFSFPQRIIYITGLFMVGAAFILFRFMRSGKTISRREGLALFIFWIIFVLVEFIANR
ncbi:sodium:calcium antiporter [bacterium]|nr:MAG: sodium:calcium antiporter [bacterium]